METQAQQISAIYNNDGSRWEAAVSANIKKSTGTHAYIAEGTDLTDACKLLAAVEVKNVTYTNSRTETSGSFDHVYIFSDASYIAICGGFWDVSTVDMKSWNGCSIVI